jgi:non-heme chloroperoxidase
MTEALMQAISVASPDGLRLAAFAAGNPEGPSILFIHGFNQCHLSWARQLNDAALARDFRMAAFDLRGHGASDKPEERARYTDDALWAGDVAAVMTATGLKRPVLAGWSYGGRVITDYLRTHGTAGIAGVNFVGALTKTDLTLMGSAPFIPGMNSEDLAENIAATRAFLRACFEKQPSQDDFETMLGFNMIIPAVIRSHVRSRTLNPGDLLAKIDVPVLVTHGEKDALVLAAMAEFTTAQVKGARLSLYPGIGHAPFWEDAPRFNRELAEFVHQVNR